MRDRSKLVLLSASWLAAVAVGFAAMGRYASTPGAVGEVPIKLIFRSRKRAELAMLKAGKVRRDEVKDARLHATDADTQGFAGDDIEAWLRDLPDDPEAYFDD